MKRYSVVLAVIAVLISGCEVPAGPTSQCLLASNLEAPTPGMRVGIGYSELGGTSVAQPFIPNSTGNMSSVSVSLQRIGTFASGNQTLEVNIESNTLAGTQMGTPNGVPLAQSAGLDVSAITSGTSSTYTFKMALVSVSAGQIYWIRIRGSYPVSKVNYVSWDAFDGATGAYWVDGVKLNAIYETSVSASNFSTAQIGTNRFLIFNIGC